MASLFFTCPTTRLEAPAGIESDVQSLQAAWKAVLKVNCSHCGGVHEISVRETYTSCFSMRRYCSRIIGNSHSSHNPIKTWSKSMCSSLPRGVLRHVSAWPGTSSTNPISNSVV
jgi:hypothetical protein